MSRHNFPPAVKSKLSERVAHVCSNPDCDRVTAGPDSTPDGVSRTGVAAHIHAASKGGPRYDEKMDEGQRRGIKNGIWLCASCSVLIDRDVVNFPANKLFQWKESAEARAMLAHNKPRPNEQDSQKQLAQMLTAAPLIGSSTVIGNVHAGVKQFLQTLDPRIEVVTEFSAGNSVYHLNAVQPVNLTFLVEPTRGKEWDAGFRRLTEHGETTLSLDGVGLEGSRLVEYIFNSGGKGSELTISNAPFHARLGLTLVGRNGEEWRFCEVSGELIAGTETARFSGATLGGALRVTLLASPHRRRSNSAKTGLTITLDRTHWNGEDVRKIPDTKTVSKLVRGLLAGARVSGKLQIDGDTVMTTNTQPADAEAAQDLAGHIYLAAASFIAKQLNVEIRFKADHPITFSMVNELQRVAGSLAFKVASDRKPGDALTFTVRPADFDLDYWRDNQGALRVMKIDQQPKSVSIFGTDVHIPGYQWIVSNSRISIVEPVLPEAEEIQCEVHLTVDSEMQLFQLDPDNQL